VVDLRSGDDVPSLQCPHDTCAAHLRLRFKLIVWQSSHVVSASQFRPQNERHCGPAASER